MPINVAMQEPRARVIGKEPNGDLVVCRRPDVDDVAPDGIVPVVRRVAGATDDGEGMLFFERDPVQANMASKNNGRQR